MCGLHVHDSSLSECVERNALLVTRATTDIYLRFARADDTFGALGTKRGRIRPKLMRGNGSTIMSNQANVLSAQLNWRHEADAAYQHH